MQTFLPYPDFKQSVSCLDPKRLGNQIYREALTLLNGGWPNHPASKMWRGYQYALCQYCIAGLNELRRRGKDYPHHYRRFHMMMDTQFPNTGLPPWLGDARLHISHQAALLHKDYR